MSADVRMSLQRADGEELRAEIDIDAGRQVVRLVSSTGPFDGDRSVIILPQELDRLVEALFYCRCLLLGRPDKNATSVEVQRRAGMLKETKR